MHTLSLALDLVHFAHRIADGSTAPSTDSATSTAALYAMVGFVGSAAIAGLFQLLTSRLGNKEAKAKNTSAVTRTQLAQLKHYQVLMTLGASNGYDFRKVKTGYERLEEIKIDNGNS